MNSATFSDGFTPSLFACIAGLAALFVVGCASTRENASPEIEKRAARQENLFFIGQDLGAIREYVNSDCCVAADGATAYVGLYNVLSEQLEFGGAGLNQAGDPISLEGSWGAGPVSAYKTATEFDVDHLAIGLFIANNEEPGALEALVAGRHDDKIRQLAKLFGHVRGTVFLRIGYEFDGAWNSGYEDAETYKAAWRRIVDTIRSDKYDNVVFVWQASAAPIDDVIEGKSEDIADWYPGDDYVDWVGLSWFIDGDERQTVSSEYTAPTARTLADEVLDFARQRRKPVMIAEAAPQAFDIANLTTSHHSPLWDGAPNTDTRPLTENELWRAWFAPFFAYVRENDDVIDAIAYINCNWESQPMWGPPYESGYWGDTRVNVNDEIAQRWNAAIKDWRGQ
jgi:hypothetical protein